MKILVTGGAGYIGSHTVALLLEAGHQVAIVDNLSNSHAAVIDRLAAISGRRPAFHQVDLCDLGAIEAVVATEKPEAVIHFAAHKAVAESVAHPLAYYTNNVGGMLNLLECMQRHKVHQLVFSSSATVYGEPETVPLPETAPLHPINPYGQTKLIGEQLLSDLAASDQAWRITSLRYFNPVGAHPSGEIGEDPTGIPDNLLPFIAQVASGRRKQLKVFGNDYDTPDGTGVRDYVHVMDVAAGHLAALTHLPNHGHDIYNLGTGQGSSVLEVIHAFEAASGHKVPYEVAPRRAGDPASCYADVSKAASGLDWRATHNLAQACADVWRWQTNHPRGYAD
jgi:UDP-glucose 4-epimerase